MKLELAKKRARDRKSLQLVKAITFKYRLDVVSSCNCRRKSQAVTRYKSIFATASASQGRSNYIQALEHEISLYEQLANAADQARHNLICVRVTGLEYCHPSISTAQVGSV